MVQFKIKFMSQSIHSAIIVTRKTDSEFKKKIALRATESETKDATAFLTDTLDYLEKNNITEVAICHSVNDNTVKSFIEKGYKNFSLIGVEEKEVLGSGGGIKLALEKMQAEQCFVISDIFRFEISLSDLSEYHFSKKAVCTVALLPFNADKNFEKKELTDEGKIISFNSKNNDASLLTNSYVYCIQRGVLIHYPVNTPFCFETNYLGNNPKAKNICGKVFDDKQKLILRTDN